MLYVPCVPAWLRTHVPINVSTCQRCANYSTWRATVPTACQFLQLACQRANFSFWRAKLPKGVLNFQAFLLRNAKGSFYILLFYYFYYSIFHYYFRKFYIILDIIVTHIIGICTVHKSCIILHFYTSCHIKKKCAEFLFFVNFFVL